MKTMLIAAAAAIAAALSAPSYAADKPAIPIIVSRQQKLAADEIDADIRRVRDAHGSLTVTMTGQRMRLIDRIEALAADMDNDRARPVADPEVPG